MSISDGLGPSIFYRKMEKERPMREEMDGKVVYFPPESALLPLMLYFSTVLFPICTLTWRANNFVSRQEEVLLGETKVQRQNFLRTFLGFWQNFTEPLRAIQANSHNLSRAFQNLFETLKTCTKLSSEQVLTIFSQSSFILHLIFIYFAFPKVNTVNLKFDSTIKRQSIINR